LHEGDVDADDRSAGRSSPAPHRVSAAHEQDLGLIERFIFISSDDPDEDDVQIKFTVMVEPKPA
jgi:hypothetical protein